MKKKIKFIHTIGNFPAEYCEQTQICYGSRRTGIKVVKDLSQIKKEQRATIKWRKKQGFETHNDYDYMRIII